MIIISVICVAVVLLVVFALLGRARLRRRGSRSRRRYFSIDLAPAFNPEHRDL